VTVESVKVMNEPTTQEAQVGGMHDMEVHVPFATLEKEPEFQFAAKSVQTSNDLNLSGFTLVDGQIIGV